jgi:hypothetical protein
LRRLWLALATAFAAGPALAFPNSFEGRLEALALLQSLNAELLSHDSATETLQRWCARLQLTEPANITAEPIAPPDGAVDAQVRALLQAGPAEAIRHRRVFLRCGDHVLSQADNWYRPARLSADMNRQLGTSDAPFGAVVRPLRFHRRTLQARLLFEPLAEGWERRPPPSPAPGILPIPAAVLEHEALLETPDGVPFSLVRETYTNEVLGVAATAPR